jgi:hypothetical protein
LSEAFGVFVQVWFAHTPTLDEEEKRSARRDAESRYRRFLEPVARRCSGGPRFLDDLPRQVVADDAELDPIVDHSTASPDKSDKRQRESEGRGDDVQLCGRPPTGAAS